MILRPLKWYEKLHSSKYRRRECRYLVEGRRQVEQMIESSPESIEEILSLTEHTGFTIPVRILTESQMKQITDSETVPELVAVGIIPESCFENPDVSSISSEKILFLEDLQDPGNVGTLLRSAAAFGFRTVILSDGCADSFSPKVVRSAAGVIPSLQIIRTNFPYRLLESLKKMEYQIVTADIAGGFDTLEGGGKTIFALGNEGNGVSEMLLSITDSVFTIPYDTSLIESLNVAIAGSIGMSQCFSNK